MDASLSSLADDLEDVTLEKTVAKAIKSEEEIESLTVDEKLIGIERAVYLLSSGQDIQRVSVIENLPFLLQENHIDCLKRVVPKVKEVLHLSQTELQIVASIAFLKILQDELVSLQCFSQTFLPTILTCVESKETDVATAWMSTLMEVIDLLPKDIIRKEILPIALEKSKFSQSVNARLTCCQLLGRISLKFEPFLLKKEIVPVVQALCQDIELEVRACMCSQLEYVARGLGLEGTRSAILPELLELTKDEACCVRRASFESLSHVISHLEEETCTSTIIPLICQFCQQAYQTQDATLSCIANELGNICHSLQGMLTDDQKRYLLDYYKSLCEVGIYTSSSSRSSPKSLIVTESEPECDQDRLSECRINAAFNFPAMVLFSGPKSFKKELLWTYSQLCSDPDVNVRSTVAASVHAVARVLDANSVTIIPSLVCLLNDTSTIVLRHLLPNLSEIVSTIHTSALPTQSREVMSNKLGELVPSLSSCASVAFSSNDWRLQEELMKSYSCLSVCLHSDVIYSHVLPVLLDRALTARARPVQLAACRSMLSLIRSLNKSEWREEYCATIVSTFCRGKKCRSRSLFIDICLMTMELYSKNFFKKHFFDPVLELCLDPVPNIRLRFSGLLPRLKGVLKLPTDRGRFQHMESSLRRLMIDENDRDVSKSVHKTIEELDKIHIPVESLSKRACVIFEQDIEDVRKEEEEKKQLELEEKEKADEQQATCASTNVNPANTKPKKTGVEVKRKTSLNSVTSKGPNKPTLSTTISTNSLGGREKARSASDVSRNFSYNSAPAKPEFSKAMSVKDMKTTPSQKKAVVPTINSKMIRRASVGCAQIAAIDSDSKTSQGRKPAIIKRKSSK